MKNKNKRLSTIQEIITSSEVGSQEELLQLLQQKGFELTQATLSRDLKQLKIAKTPEAGSRYVYRIATQKEEEPSKVNMFNSLNRQIVIDFSGNIAVLHTRAGYASSLAYEIDERAGGVIIGTVAGEDTIVAVIKENKTNEDVMNNLSRFITGLVQKQ